MSIEEWIDLCEHAQLMNADWTEREAKLAFIEAMMTQADEMKTRKHKEMSFVEFLEAVSCLCLFCCLLGGCRCAPSSHIVWCVIHPLFSWAE